MHLVYFYDSICKHFAPSVRTVRSCGVLQAAMYHEQHPEDGGASKENRMVYSDSMPRRVGSFYRGQHELTHTDIIFL